MASEVDIDDLHDAILDALRAKFPAVTVDEYVEARKQLQLPAMLLELAECEPSDDNPGTEQTAIGLRFRLLIVLSFRTENAKREVRKLAVAATHLIHRKRFLAGAGPARVLQAGPDMMRPADLDQFEVWSVEWVQTIYVGENIWDAIPDFIGEPIFSWEPRVGIGNEDYYRQLPELIPPGEEVDPE